MCQVISLSSSHLRADVGDGCRVSEKHDRWNERTKSRDRNEEMVRIRTLNEDGHTVARRLAVTCPSCENQLAQSVGANRFNLKIALLLGLCILLAGCGARSTKVGPNIEITKIPVAGEGSPDKLYAVEGRVVDSRPGQQIVLFARWGPWWIQPFADRPFTTIQSDSTWRNLTHPGTEYAALLVDERFRAKATLDVMPKEGDGVIAVAITKGRPALWQSWWFLAGVSMSLALAVVAVFNVRMHRVSRQLSLRLEERLAERNRIAQELHDTLLQNFLSVSMQLHVANDQLAVDSPAKLLVSRALDMIGRVIDEGRNTVQGLRSSDWGSEDLEKAFSRIQEELAVPKEASFRVIVEGLARPLRRVIGDDVFLIGREALANAFHHSAASEIEVEIEYAAEELKLSVRDNGRGIARDVLHSNLSGHWGLSGMRERAERIGAKLRFLSRVEAGTEIVLCVPSVVAYLTRDSDRPMRWFSKMRPRKRTGNDLPVESERVR
jgi:signal transduction histidine kinase